MIESFYKTHRATIMQYGADLIDNSRYESVEYATGCIFRPAQYNIESYSYGGTHLCEIWGCRVHIVWPDLLQTANQVSPESCQPPHSLSDSQIRPHLVYHYNTNI